MLDVRLLAALDLHGMRGGRARRAVITAEFVASACIGLGLGLWVAVSADSAGWKVFGLWIAGVGANYVPLAVHALSMLRGDTLWAALRDVDLDAELRRYSVLQFWLVVPLLFAVLAIVQLRGRRGGAAR